MRSMSRKGVVTQGKPQKPAGEAPLDAKMQSDRRAPEPAEWKPGYRTDIKWKDKRSPTEECLHMLAEIADRKEEIARICRRCRVSRLEIFGSAARGTDFDPETSDVDFLVQFSADNGGDPLGQFFDLVDALSDALGRPVDLVEKGAVTNPYLLAAINRSRELVYTERCPGPVD